MSSYFLVFLLSYFPFFSFLIIFSILYKALLFQLTGFNSYSSGGISMSLSTQINDRISYLEKLVTREKKALAYAPEGRLRGTVHGRKYQYYCRYGQEDRSALEVPVGANGIYIKSDNTDYIKRLGQKEYNKRVLKAAEAERACLVKAAEYYKNHDSQIVEHVYDALPKWNRDVVTPLEEPWDKFISKWSKGYSNVRKPVPESQRHTNADGIQMRSKSEELIAELLKRFNIPFVYEKPLYLRGYGTIYPDFTAMHPIHREEVYWEHLGLIDKDDYRRTAFAKISEFERNGYFLGERLIITYETYDRPLSMPMVRAKIERFLLR